MKKLFYILTGLLYASCQSSVAQKTSEKEHISKRIEMPSDGFVGIYNLFGDVTVEGYDGNEVILEIDKIYKADNQSELEMAKTEFKLEFEKVNDSLLVYISEPWYTRPGKHYHRNDQRKMNYFVQLDFKVKIPRNCRLKASTVNEGTIQISQVAGLLEANNVNGDVFISDAEKVSMVHTVNGEIKVEFNKAPTEKGSFKTINGAINLDFVSDISADVSLKTMNGEYFTNFNYVNSTNEVSKEENFDKNGQRRFKINQTQKIKIGDGKVKLSLETLNGNIYLKNKNS